MDLLERGRSLGELGRSLRWTDMRAFLAHLPVDSHTAEAMDPEGIRDRRIIAELLTPRTQFVAAVHDSLESAVLGLAGARAESGIIKRIAHGILSNGPEVQQDNATPSGRGLHNRRAEKSAAEIRALVAARMKA
ncbi:hypothetical protein [Corynebacterium cystitidis]|uniref:hypothetical protein n=1 Tax=Corynebacterium cystitidis TaxID=35757 RepID=UPI00211EF027|nr:hypothetical protein [Corynebacterium cystitidis]